MKKFEYFKKVSQQQDSTIIFPKLKFFASLNLNSRPLVFMSGFIEAMSVAICLI